MMGKPNYQEAQVLSNGQPLLCCFVCLVRPQSSPTDRRLTIVNGNMLCVDHLHMADWSGDKLTRYLQKGI